MRISDWSSDVCSSDLRSGRILFLDIRKNLALIGLITKTDKVISEPLFINKPLDSRRLLYGQIRYPQAAARFQDRKSVVSGKSVSVRVDLGGRRIIKKKKTINSKYNTERQQI